MASAYERIYEIAAGALQRQQRQQRQLADTRAGIPPVGAAAAVIGVALAGDAFKAPGTVNTLFALIGGVGAGLVLVCGVLTLLGVGVGRQFSVDAIALSKKIQGELGDADRFHLSAAQVYDDTRRANAPGIARARLFFGAALVGLILEAAGFVIALVVHFSE